MEDNQRRKYQLSVHEWIILGFAAIIVVGGLLLTLPIASATGERVGLLDALFTATSAVCVTGLIVVDTASTFSMFGEIVLLVLIQIGGLGFMTFGVVIAILLGKKIGIKERLLIQESTKSTSVQGLVKLSLNIFMIAFLFEVIASIILTIRWHAELGLGRAIYYAVFHSISAFNNAGFALWPDSMGRYMGDPVINLVISMLFIIGGIGFTVLIDLYKNRRWKKLSLNSKIVLLTSTLLTLSGFFVLFILELLNPAGSSLTWGERVWVAYFQGVAPRSGGFTTFDISQFLTASQFFMIALMFIGGSSGSTAGGIKTNTFMVLVLAMYSSIRGRESVHVFDRRVANDVVLRALAVIIISLGAVIVVAFLLTITERQNHDFIVLLFEATSAFATVGLSLGVTSELTWMGKVIVMITMFAGRLGPLTLAYALARRKREMKIGYPEEKVLIG
jgi:trk system potassium uptake protein TrkH